MQEPKSGRATAVNRPERQENSVDEAEISPELSLADLFMAQESALLAYAWKIVEDRETAEDIVQEAFIKLHGCYTQVQQPRAWLYRTIHNLALNILRSRRRSLTVQTLDEASHECPDTQPLPDDQIARLEAIGQTRLSLEAMNPRSRELLRLKFEEGLSYRNIAQRTQLTVSNVGYLLHHALKQMAAELKQHGFIP
jgi:RNA polymerase sigma factor (sigma-70 family)